MNDRSAPGQPADSLQQWLCDLPKVELHCHLEGSMSVDTVAALSVRHGVDPTILWPDGLPQAFSFIDFPDFGLQYFYGVSMLRSAEDIASVTEDLAVTLASQNVRYAELTTTAYTYFLDTAGLEVGRPPVAPEEYRDGLNEGRRRAASHGVDLGLRSLPHAGETEGADSVRQALVDLGADRIGHGVRSPLISSLSCGSAATCSASIGKPTSRCSSTPSERRMPVTL